jgi:serine/threonine protein kinase
LLVKPRTSIISDTITTTSIPTTKSSPIALEYRPSQFQIKIPKRMLGDMINQMWEKPSDEVLNRVHALHKLIDDKTEISCYAVLAIAASIAYFSTFDDYIPEKSNKEVMNYIAKVLPWILLELYPTGVPQIYRERPEKYYTKSQLLDSTAIRELCIYALYPTEVECYGWQLVHTDDSWTLEIYIEVGVSDLVQLLGVEHTTNGYTYLVENKKSEFLLPEERRLELEADMIASVQWLRKYELVHRDLKPENWIVTTTGRLKLIDFGTTVSAGLLVQTADLTYPYLPPEYRYPKRKDSMIVAATSHDIWSLGCSLLQLHTLTIPFVMFDYTFVLRKLQDTLRSNEARRKLLLRMLVLKPKYRKLN